MEKTLSCFYPRPELVELTGLSYSTIWRMIQADQFPKPVKLSARRVAWRKVDVDSWIQSRQVGVGITPQKKNRAVSR